MEKVGLNPYVQVLLYSWKAKLEVGGRRFHYIVCTMPARFVRSSLSHITLAFSATFCMNGARGQWYLIFSAKISFSKVLLHVAINVDQIVVDISQISNMIISNNKCTHDLFINSNSIMLTLATKRIQNICKYIVVKNTGCCFSGFRQLFAASGQSLF